MRWLSDACAARGPPRWRSPGQSTARARRCLGDCPKGVAVVLVARLARAPSRPDRPCGARFAPHVLQASSSGFARRQASTPDLFLATPPREAGHPPRRACLVVRGTASPAGARAPAVAAGNDGVSGSAGGGHCGPPATRPAAGRSWRPSSRRSPTMAGRAAVALSERPQQQAEALLEPELLERAPAPRVGESISHQRRTRRPRRGTIARWARMYW